MKKFLLAMALLAFAGVVSLSGVRAAPVTHGFSSMPQFSYEQEDMTDVHIRGGWHNCRRHGFCAGGGGGGIYIGPGGIFVGPGHYGGARRSCRRTRRWCRREWGGGRRYRRCVRRRGCRV